MWRSSSGRSIEPSDRLTTQVAAANAVLANGTLAHGLDYDDTLEEAIVHTGCCAGMTALAVGEELRASGKAVLEGAIAGTEVMCKIGLVAPGKFHARGFHPTALCSTFGAAAAAGKLHGLDAAQWSDAFGLCGSQSSGIIEYLADGTWTKRLHPGWSAHGGVIATLLAQQGFRGPTTVFEGTHGFYRAFGGANEYPFEKFSELGRTWEIPKLTFKSYPCGSISHPYYGLRPDLETKIRYRAGASRGNHLPYGGGSGTSPLGAAGTKAQAAHFLRGQVQSAF